MTNPYHPGNFEPNMPGYAYAGGQQYAEPYAPPPYQHGIDFGRAIGAPFKSPNWVMNTVWVAICFALSMVVVGGIVLIGYQMEVIDRRSRARSDEWPDFDPNRFGDYLSRGLWPWLVYIILSMALVVPLWLFMGISMAIVGAVFGNGESALVPLLVIAIMSVFVSVLFAAMTFIVGPLALRAGLASDLGQGFNFRWALDFGKRVWGQMLLVFLCTFVIGIVAEVVGLLLCFVGLLVTFPIAQMMFTDFGAQLYDIYLTRGGEPVPTRPTQSLF